MSTTQTKEAPQQVKPEGESCATKGTKAGAEKSGSCGTGAKEGTCSSNKH